ncbi:hypothetical protein NDU88_002934, partial [Pleurodeles waltl]
EFMLLNRIQGNGSAFLPNQGQVFFMRTGFKNSRNMNPSLGHVDKKRSLSGN